MPRDSLEAEFLESGQLPQRDGESREGVVGDVEDEESSQATDGGRQLRELVVLDIQLHQVDQVTHTLLWTPMAIHSI